MTQYWNCIGCKKKIEYNQKQRAGKSFTDKDCVKSTIKNIPKHRIGEKMYPLKCPECELKQYKYLDEFYESPKSKR